MVKRVDARALVQEFAQEVANQTDAIWQGRPPRGEQACEALHRHLSEASGDWR